MNLVDFTYYLFTIHFSLKKLVDFWEVIGNSEEGRSEGGFAYAKLIFICIIIVLLSHKKRHPMDVFFQLYLPTASYIAAQFYFALLSVIVLRTVKRQILYH